VASDTAHVSQQAQPTLAIGEYEPAGLTGVMGHRERLNLYIAYTEGLMAAEMTHLSNFTPLVHYLGTRRHPYRCTETPRISSHAGDVVTVFVRDQDGVDAVRGNLETLQTFFSFLAGKPAINH